MKLISFDVGIKNMAYCIIECNDGNINVQDWNVLDLLDNEKKDKTCTFKMRKKKKGVEVSSETCGKKAKHMNRFSGQTFCETHAKMAIKQNNWFFVNNEFKNSQLMKKSREELYNLGQNVQIFSNMPKTKRESLIMISDHCERRGLEKVKKEKSKTANDIDLISVGKKMKTLLNQIEGLENITHVIIENQISKIASRMKTVQGMLTQYFIMREICPHIEYISSSNKLKDFDTKENSYKQHKIDSIEISKKILDINILGKWDLIFQTTKKDDLADAFLQGLWYLKNKKIITYAENLKINCVSLT